MEKEEDSVAGEGSGLTRGADNDPSQWLTLLDAITVMTNLKLVSYESRGEIRIKVRRQIELTRL